MNETNGKIKGKFNIIDLIIVILLLAAVAFLGYRFLTRGNADADTQKVYLTMTGAEVSKYVVDNLEIGAPVLDDAEHKSLGYVTDISTDRGYHYDVDKSGQTVAIFPDDSVSVVVTCLAEGTLDGNGLVIGRTRYAIGHTFVVYVGNCKMYLRISGLWAA